MVLGKATKDSTENNCVKYKDITYKNLSGTDLFVSNVGFGGYRIDNNSSSHRIALEKALLEGINLIDTSSNYGNGSSEVLIGCVLHDLTFENKISRESVVVVTKGGYIQGANYIDYKQREQKGFLFQDVVDLSDGFSHCIHPDYLEMQLTISLQRMNLDVIDVYLLHNPEYYLSKASTSGLSIKEIREEYYRRIKLAFEFLEEQVSKGKIQYYGVSSNTFGYDSDSFEFTSLEKLIQIANEIKQDNHFKVIELPLNIYEPETVILNNNDNDSKSVIDYAIAKNIGVLTNRPFNAIKDNHILRLVDIGSVDNVSSDDINNSIVELNKFEKKLKDELLSQIDLDNRFVSDILNVFSFSDDLLNSWNTFDNLDYWQNVMSQYFLPRLLFCKRAITEYKQITEDLWTYIDQGIQLGSNVLASITDYYKIQQSETIDNIKNQLELINNQYSINIPLSHNIIDILTTTKGVSSVLVGMRQKQYVEDVLQAIKETKNSSKTIYDWESKFFITDKEFSLMD